MDQKVRAHLLYFVMGQKSIVLHVIKHSSFPKGKDSDAAFHAHASLGLEVSFAASINCTFNNYFTKQILFYVFLIHNK